MLAGGFNILWMAEPVEIGDEVDRANWPLHLTLSTNFDLGRDVAALERVVDSVSRTAMPVEVVVSSRALFGAHENVPVALVDPVEPLRQLHVGLVESLTALGAEFHYPQHVFEHYRPHITDIDDRLRRGDRFLVDSLTVFGLNPPGSRGHARALATYRLGGTRDGIVDPRFSTERSP